MSQKREDTKFIMGLKKDTNKLELSKELSFGYAQQYKALRKTSHKYGGSIILMKVLYLFLDMVLALVCGKSIEILR